MAKMLELCGDFPDVDFAPGEVFLHENKTTDKLFVLSQGAVEVFRGDVTVAVVTEPGSIFGEMSLLLGIPHTASVRAASPAKLRVVPNAMTYLADHPSMLVPIAQLLARRLQSSTTYLVDLKHQFQHRSDHFGMVDEVLESLSHQQHDDFTSGADLPPEP